MKIESLTLTNFRNIQSMRFVPRPGVNIICGDNAQGKTNLLEAVWLFLGARSFRSAKESEFIAFGEEEARLEMVFSAQGRSQNARILFRPEKKVFTLNQIDRHSPSEFSGAFCAVVFFPDHLNLVKQGPEHRRRLVDQSLCQAYPKYAKALEGYGRILQQRGNLLRDAAYHAELLDTLDAWDETLLEYGSYIASTRARYLERLGLLAEEVYGGIASKKERLTVRYQHSFHPEEAVTDRGEIRAGMAEALRAARPRDLQSGVTHIGPHRDDLLLLLGGKNARSFGSQGQQRSIVLSLKLAECAVLAGSCGEEPVVLLDDVMSELDEGRRSYLLREMKGRQVLITCCDTSAFKGAVEREAIFPIAEGALVS